MFFEDVFFWIYWDDVFGGEVFKFGDLKLFLENEGILWSVKELLLKGYNFLVVMEIIFGVFFRIIIYMFIEIFRKCVFCGDVIGVVGYLVFIVIVNGGVVNIFVIFLVNYVYFFLVLMGVDDEGDCD